MCYRTAYGYSLKMCTVCKYHCYGCYPISDSSGGEADATREGIVADVGHRVGNGDRGEAATILEGILTDDGHLVWDGDGGEAAAVREGI